MMKRLHLKNTTTKLMANKTAMQQLKEKIQVVIGEMNGELSSYESGYKQCLINIQNDIDLQMMAMEKEQKTMKMTFYPSDYLGLFTLNVINRGEIDKMNYWVIQD